MIAHSQLACRTNSHERGAQPRQQLAELELNLCVRDQCSDKFVDHSRRSLADRSQEARQALVRLLARLRVGVVRAAAVADEERAPDRAEFVQQLQALAALRRQLGRRVLVARARRKRVEQLKKQRQE